VGGQGRAPHTPTHAHTRAGESGRGRERGRGAEEGGARPVHRGQRGHHPLHGRRPPPPGPGRRRRAKPRRLRRAPPGQRGSPLAAAAAGRHLPALWRNRSHQARRDPPAAGAPAAAGRVVGVWVDRADGRGRRVARERRRRQGRGRGGRRPAWAGAGGGRIDQGRDADARPSTMAKHVGKASGVRKEGRGDKQSRRGDGFGRRDKRRDEGGIGGRG
jgi:hypothetical protein